MNIESETLELAKQLNESPQIGKLSTKDIRKILTNYQTLILFEQDTIKGLVGYKALGDEYCEISPIFIKKQYQGLGLGSFMLDEFLKLHSGKHILACTRNEILVKLLVKKGFIETSLKKLPLNVMLRHLMSVRLYRIYDNYKKGILNGWKYYLKTA